MKVRRERLTKLALLSLLLFLFVLMVVVVQRWNSRERAAVESFLGVSPKEIEAIEKMLQGMESDRETPRLLQDYEEYFEMQGIVPTKTK